MKILLSNASYVGDTILATSLLAVLKSAFPDCKIGFLSSSWAKEVVEDHALIDWVHIYDHQKLNRELFPKREKRERARTTSKRALKEIKEIGYDIAFELYSYYKNHAGALLYHAAIPKRVGYIRSQAPFFFNELVSFEWFSFHMVENHGKMVYEWGIEKSHLKKLAPLLEYKSELERRGWAEKLPAEYLLIHSGTGEPLREWDLLSWKKLIEPLQSLGYPLVFIGKGKKEKQQVLELSAGVKDCVDLVDKLSLRETMEVVKGAKLVLGVESMAGHLAACFKVPGVFIYSGFVLIDQWRPFSDTCEVLQPKGYDLKRECPPAGQINTITPEEVFETVVKQLEKFNKIKVTSAPSLDLSLFDRGMK